MKLVETNIHWISGMMVGFEFVHGSDFVEGSGVQYGFCLDLFIIRVLVLVREV